jgi:hypothetical protein
MKRFSPYALREKQGRTKTVEAENNSQQDERNW